jgi:LAO/AO transport system kinase
MISKLLTERVELIRKKDYELLEIELKDMVLNIIKDKILTMLNDNPSYHNLIDKIQKKKMDPFQAAEELTSNLLNISFSKYQEHNQT